MQSGIDQNWLTDKLSVTEGKGLGQPACPREWKKYEEKN
jgi:hypothetical protein